MSNESGHLSKVPVAELDDGLARRLAQWREHAYDDDNVFLTMAKRPQLYEAMFEMMGYLYGGGSTIDAELTELCRLKLAFHNQCVH